MDILEPILRWAGTKTTHQQIRDMPSATAPAFWSQGDQRWAGQNWRVPMFLIVWHIKSASCSLLIVGRSSWWCVGAWNWPFHLKTTELPSEILIAMQSNSFHKSLLCLCWWCHVLYCWGVQDIRKIDSCELNRIVMRKGEIVGFMSFYTALYVEGNC